MSVIQIIYDNRIAFYHGLLVTLKLAAYIWILGLGLGSIVGALSAKLNFVCRANKLLSFLLSGIPALVLLFWVHYPLQAILKVVIDPFITAVAVLSIINIFGVSSIIFQSLYDFPKQYVIAANVCGLTPKQIFLKIKLPIILRQVLPSILMSQVNMLQMTLFASLISVEEIFRVVQRINASIYKPVELYSTLAIFFLIICLPLNAIALWLKKKYTRNISEK